MNISENNTLNYTQIDKPYEVFEDNTYHIYFAYNIKETVTDAKINASINGEKFTGYTVERCTHQEMTAMGNVYVVHIVLDKYHYKENGMVSRVVRLTGGWRTNELPIDIPISIQVIQTGCETTMTE